MQIKKIAQIGSYYIYPALLAVASFTFPSLDLFGKFGTLAFYLLAGNLFLRPFMVLVRLWPIQTLFTLRREIGIASFWSYVFHSLGMIYTFALKPAELLSDPTSFIFFGALAGIGMYALGLTSNDLAVRLLKRNWKRLHRIAYLVFFLSLYHSSLAEGEPAKLYLFGGAFIIAKVLEFRKTPFVW
jgi:sulfoxide reductase heme-binding subunit YedZ